VTHLLIVGGSDAGTMAALRARDLDPVLDITMVLADSFPNYSICGLPFYVSREVPEMGDLAHRRAADIAERGIELLMDHTAVELDPHAKRVVVRAADGRERPIAYDTVVIATGARPRTSGIRGADLTGVYPLHTMIDGLKVRARVDGGRVQSVVIIGAGYIGLEMADALRHRGLQVTLLSRPRSVLPTVDPSLAKRLEVELAEHDVAVRTGVTVTGIVRGGEGLEVRTDDGTVHPADVVLLGVGVEPNSELARDAGIPLGVRSAIKVDRQMRTSAPDVFAAGDCVETWHRLLRRPSYMPLGTTAHKQGRIAGENAVGGAREFQGALGTQVVKVFTLAAARTGLRDDDARAGGFDPVTVESEPWDHKVYYPGAKKLHMRVTGDRSTGRLLGAQIVGPYDASIAKRIDIYATALFHGMSVHGMDDLDLSYTPPLGAPWDAVQEATQKWVSAQGPAAAAWK
jgi:NADPH-dependent 2,4-dienoyl-CoA reductase/sulfur reductase-like enzyme